MTFPEGVLLLPPKPEINGQKERLRRLDPPACRRCSRKEHVGPPQPTRKRTKLRPPADALSLQDRLFYLLQPPLESWLAGQELVMPFEPFPFQYEGIAWLFSQKSALLADEMGLGKTMQAITAIRLLLRSARPAACCLSVPSR